MLFMDTKNCQKWQNGENRVNKMCFIGRNLDRKLIEDGIKSCLAGELRFKIGEKVDVGVGPDTWEEGTVIRLWDEGHPYRVRLDDSGDEIWADFDEDDMITKAE